MNTRLMTAQRTSAHPTLVGVAALVVVAGGVAAVAAGCGETCASTRDCALDEICDASGVCVTAPPPPAGGEGEGDAGEGEGDAGEGEGDAGEGEGDAGGEGEGDTSGGGVCATAFTMSSDHVYLIGPLNHFGGGKLAIADIANPGAYEVGFTSFITGAVVGGSLIYTAFAVTDAPLRFTPDAHPYRSDGFAPDDDPNLDCTYPSDEQIYANDERLTEACAGHLVGQDFAVAPDGSFLMECAIDNIPAWHTADGTEITALHQNRVIALSSAGIALTDVQSDGVVDVTANTSTPLSADYPFSAPLRAHVAADRFIVAEVRCDGAQESARMEVQFDGSLAVVGSYDLTGLSSCDDGSVVLANGDVVAAATPTGSNARNIYRLTESQPPQLVYDNALNPPVSSDFGPELFTGP